MDHKNIITAPFLMIVSLLLAGCMSTEETAEKPKQETPPPIIQQKPVQPPVSQIQPTKTDTVSVTTQVPAKENPQQTTAPESLSTKAEPGQPVSAVPTGNFAVQIGAFSVADKAGAIASLAKQRFGKNVYTLQAKDTGLFKVMVGDFLTKDEARKFRDRMAQQFPDDYKDAWVAPIPTDK